ncbi:hypothetical protein LCGC14_0824880 [marine sediment metagenome]|uniref:Putative regulatory protein FmdB zinc ribbon domain-containing protein n=1 Tax=marine sediment metagenome TaxID=412755 RepID=A0A0F9SQA1_9ZZZZ
MALYDYECNAGHPTEARRPFMSVEEDPGVICRQCRRVARRIFTAPVGVGICGEWELVAMPGEPDVPTRVV